MRRKAYIRHLLIAAVTATSLILFSYSHKKSDPNAERSSECGGKSDEKKAQSEFILWESLTRNLLSARS